MLVNPSLVQANATDILRYGESLAKEERWKPFMEGFAGQDADIRRSRTAVLLENQLRFLQSMNEVTRTLMIGQFDKFALPLVRAVYPNLISNEIVDVQPMAGPTTLVFYLDFLYASNKGNVTSGSTAFDARSGPTNSEFYSSETVPLEAPARSGGSADTDPFVGTLAYTPLRPGTVTVQFNETTSGTARSGTDDGAGNIVGTGITSSTVDYMTGALSIQAAANNVDDSTMQVSYRYVSEANENIPMMDMRLTSAPVMARPRKLRFRYSLEAAQDANALHSLDVQQELVATCAEQIKFDIDREVINDLTSFAGAGHAQWDKTTPPGVSWNDHKLSLVDSFVQASNLVFGATKKGYANWAVCGLSVCDIIETLPNFQPVPNAFTTQQQTGIQKIGTLGGRWTIYKDPFYPAAKWLAGWKGGSWLETGYVLSPYIPIYTTPQIILDDFIGRQGIATRYGKKSINNRFYVTGEVLNA